MPKVSIILTSFNHEKYIREAIDSVLAQTYTDFELIIWDDASTDNSWEIINSYSDLRIKAFRNETNQRYVINRAIKEVASGEYIAIHHSDDIWESEKLEKQVDFLDSNLHVGAVFTNTLTIGEDSEPLNDTEHFYSRIFDQPNRSRHEWLNYFFYQGNALCHPSVLIRRQCYTNCGMYQYGLSQIPDFDMWIRLCMKYEVYVLPEKLVRFRVRANEANTSGIRLDTKIRFRTEIYQVLSRFLEVDSAHDILSIFPLATKYCTGDVSKANPKYLLAMLLLESEQPYARLLSFDILFDLMSQKASADQVKAHHNFDHLDLIRLTGMREVFYDGKNVLLHQQNAELSQQNAELSQQIASILNSKSWRLTKPLRFIQRKLAAILAQ